MISFSILCGVVCQKPVILAANIGSLGTTMLKGELQMHTSIPAVSPPERPIRVATSTIVADEWTKYEVMEGRRDGGWHGIGWDGRCIPFMFQVMAVHIRLSHFLCCVCCMFQ